jgi:alpha-1,2-mannosyltransferase
MPAHARRLLILVAVACAPFCLGAWSLYRILFRHAPAQDFMVFHTAARAVWERNLPLLFDGQAFTDRLNGRFAGVLDGPLTLHPWVYPPLFLLLAAPFGLLPFWSAYAAFLLLTLGLLIAALRTVVAPGWPRVVCTVSLLFSPATAFTVVVGQNAFLTTALMVGGFGLSRRAPVWAGVLLGGLTFKPQLWLLVPIALLARRQWRVLAIAIATSVLFALLSLAAFGLEPWRQWLGLMLGRDPQFQDWLTAGRMYGQSLFTDAVLLGAPHALAQAAQAAAVLAGAAVAWVAFRRADLPEDMQLAVLLTAALIAAPHVSNYDAVMLAVAVSLLLCRGIADGFRAGDLLLVIVAWGIEVLNPPKVIPVGLVTPLVLAALIWALFRRTGDGGAVAARGR